jgi:3-phenylpropionate/cinnamic acid dioxygenase small subunit
VETDDDGMTLQAAVEFIWREADLLDARDYEGWLRLWTPEGLYIIPIDRDAADHAANLNIAYDDGPMREARVKRLHTGVAMSVASAARTVRTLSRFVPVAEQPDVLELRCAQHVVEQKREYTRVLAADVTYRLVDGPAGIALDRKIVRLIDSDEAQHGIGYLL